eukprot:8796993-Pyramimonas_sp.AAC.1
MLALLCARLSLELAPHSSGCIRMLMPAARVVADAGVLQVPCIIDIGVMVLAVVGFFPQVGGG